MADIFMTSYNFFWRDLNLQTKLQRKELTKALIEGKRAQKFFLRAIDYPPIIGRVECISYSFTVYQGALSWHWDQHYPRVQLQQGEIFKNSGLDPHHGAFLGFLSLPGKRKKSTYFNWNCRCTDLGDFLHNLTFQSFCWLQISHF